VLGRSIGLTDDEILQLRGWRESELYGPVDRLALEYIEAWKLHRQLLDELYRRLTGHFTTRQIIDLCFTGGVADLINRFHATFGTDIDDGTLADEQAVEVTPRLPNPA
jgi:alkylhydroperoxidase family enzyme